MLFSFTFNNGQMAEPYYIISGNEKIKNQPHWVYFKTKLQPCFKPDPIHKRYFFGKILFHFHFLEGR